MFKSLRFSFTSNFTNRFKRCTLQEIIEDESCDRNGRELGQLEALKFRINSLTAVNEWLLAKMYREGKITETEIKQMISETIVNVDENWELHTDGKTRYDV